VAFPLTVTQTLTTTASPEAVWRAFEAVEQWPTAIHTLAAAKLEPKGALAPGSIIRTRAAPGSNTADRDYRVVTAEKPRYLVLAVEDPDYRAVTRYAIAPHSAQETDVVVTSTLDAVGVTQSIRLLAWRARMAPVLKANTRERAQGLIDLAERLAERPTAPGTA
jgi:uncharacterized protein YndB with AHSA1/START domain